jgi:OmpA-OmpF porin, OOP family
MSSTLIDSVKSVFTDTLLSKFAVLLGESESNVQKAVHGAIPMVLTDIVHKAYFPEGTAKVANLGRQAANGDFFGHLHELSVDAGGLVAGSALLNKGTDFARSLLASRTDPVIGEVSRHAGISIPSATFMTGIVSFAALDAVGRHLANTNLDSNGLATWLKIQGDSIVHAIPVGLQVKPALGINHYPWERPAAARRNTALYIIVSLLVIALIIFFFYRSCGRVEMTAPAGTRDTTVAATVPAPAPASTDTVSSPAIKVTLPNGKVLDAYKGGMEDRLVNFLSDHNAKLDKKNGNWFDFTKIDFASNSARLLLESEGQLKNIVAILDAFPKVKIKIGGYSDNTGDSTDNARLSQQRADNILAKLKELGAKSSQLTGSEGYGSNYPVGDNGTASGRAMNRRMSINVKAK